MKTTLFLLLTNAIFTTSTAVVDPNLVGEQMKVLEVVKTKVPDEESRPDCVFIRRFKVEYKYLQPQTTLTADNQTTTHDRIYYLVLQC